jgi:hypothetical protein
MSKGTKKLVSATSNYKSWNYDGACRCRNGSVFINFTNFHQFNLLALADDFNSHPEGIQDEGSSLQVLEECSPGLPPIPRRNYDKFMLSLFSEILQLIGLKRHASDDAHVSRALHCPIFQFTTVL